MTADEELEALRAFKREHDGNALNRAFERLDALLDVPYSSRGDTVLSVRAFRVIAEALIELKKEFMK